MRRLYRRLIGVTLIGMLLYGLFVLYADYQKVASSLGAFRWGSFAAALSLATGNYGLRFLKWEYYLSRLGIRGVGKLDSLLIFLSGFVLTVSPGKIGEVFKSAVLAETHGVPAASTAPIVVAERLTDVIAVIALIFIGSAGFAGGLPWALTGSALVAVGLGLIMWQRPIRWAIGLVGRSGRLGRLAPKLHHAFDNLRILASPAALLWPTLLSIVGWGAEGVAFYLLLDGFGQSVPVAVAVFFYATATLAGAIIPMPGGLGPTEALLQEQLVRIGGVAQGPATASMLLIRFATLWWAVVVGFVALGLLRTRYRGLFADRDPMAESKP